MLKLAVSNIKLLRGKLIGVFYKYSNFLTVDLGDLDCHHIETLLMILNIFINSKSLPLTNLQMLVM